MIKKIICKGDACNNVEQRSVLEYEEGYFLDAIEKGNWMLTHINGQDQPVCPVCKNYHAPR